MTAPEDAAFRVSARYWPSATGPYWWEAFSEAAVQRDFEAAAERGLTYLDIALQWNDFEPTPDRVPARPMRALERVLDHAFGFGLRLTITVLQIEAFGRLWVPGWALAPGTTAALPVLSGHHESRTGIRDVFTDPRVAPAQRRLVREVTTAFRDHPTVRAWTLVDRIQAAHGAVDSAEWTTWMRQLLGSADDRGADQGVRYGTSARELIGGRHLNTVLLREYGVDLVVHDDWQPRWAEGVGSTWLQFLGGYAAGLSAGAAELAATVPCAPREHRSVAGSAAFLDAIARSGASGALAPLLVRPDGRLLRSTPFRDYAGMESSGLLDARGGLTADGRAWQELSQAPPARPVMPELFTDIDFERRDRMPELVAREYFAAFTE